MLVSYEHPSFTHYLEMFIINCMNIGMNNVHTIYIFFPRNAPNSLLTYMTENIIFLTKNLVMILLYTQQSEAKSEFFIADLATRRS